MLLTSHFAIFVSHIFHPVSLFFSPCFFFLLSSSYIFADWKNSYVGIKIYIYTYTHIYSVASMRVLRRLKRNPACWILSSFEPDRTKEIRNIIWHTILFSSYFTSTHPHLTLLHLPPKICMLIYAEKRFGR